MRIALFDLDGTITRRDTLVPYVFGFCLRRPGRLLGALRMPGHLLSYLAHRDRGRLKQALVRSMLRGISRSDVSRWNERWAPQLVRKAVHAQALRRIAAHRQDGDHLVLMSASPDLYVPALARLLGFNETICTGMRWNGMHLDGALTTANRRGSEKLRCVQALRQRYENSMIIAYGNSASDLEHMGACEYAYLVNASARTIQKAARGPVHVGWPA